MTDKQATILYRIIQHVKENPGPIPTGEQLSSVLGCTKRNANDHLKRLEAKGYFERRGERRHLKENNLVFERPTAVCLLAIRQLYQQRKNKQEESIPKSAIYKHLLAQRPTLFPDQSSIEIIITRCTAAGYLTVMYFDPEQVRPGERMSDELNYLRLLAGKLETATKN